MSKIKDLTGQRFGKLLVLKKDPKKNYKLKWICKCDCGKTKSIVGYSLRKGVTTSCGCHQRNIVRKRSQTHKESKTRFYRIWAGIIQRCNNPNNSKYSVYGKRGITVCDRWLVYENFKEDMHESYLIHFEKHGNNTTIDRLNVNGNYELSNCKWSTLQEQNSNRRNNIEFIGINPSINIIDINCNKTEFAKKHGLNRGLIHNCLKGNQSTHKGWKFMYILRECKQ